MAKDSGTFSGDSGGSTAVAVAIATAIAMRIAIPLNPDTIIEMWHRLMQDDDNNIKLEQEYEVHHCFVH